MLFPVKIFIYLVTNLVSKIDDNNNCFSGIIPSKLAFLDLKMTISVLIYKLNRAGNTGCAEGAMAPYFLRSKNKKGRQREKWKGFKAETIKKLSPRSKYYCLEFEIFSCRSTMVAANAFQCSMPPPPTVFIKLRNNYFFIRKKNDIWDNKVFKSGPSKICGR